MSEFKGNSNPILETTDKVLSIQPYRKETHPTFGVNWYTRGGLFTIPDDNRQFFLSECANRKGIRKKRYIPFTVNAGIASLEYGGWFTEEYTYSPDPNSLAVVHSMAPSGETWQEFRSRQRQLRRETFGPDSTAGMAERIKFLDLIELLGEKGILLSQQG